MRVPLFFINVFVAVDQAGRSLDALRVAVEELEMKASQCGQQV